MEKLSEIAQSLDARLKIAATTHGLDLEKLAGRTLVEGILRYWAQGMGPAPVLLTGGLLFDQTVRETRDADIAISRRYRCDDIVRGMETIARLLEREGMRLDFTAPVPQADTGCGSSVERWIIEGKVGGVAASVNLNMDPRRGAGAVIEASELSEIPSLVSGIPPLAIACQPLEAAAAEKLLAAVLQPESDFRIRHLADVIDERLWVDVDCRDVAREMMGVCRYRGIDVRDLPATLEWPAIQRLESAWERHRAAGKTTLSIFSAWIDAAYLWSEVKAELGLRHKPFVVQRPGSNVARMFA